MPWKHEVGGSKPPVLTTTLHAVELRQCGGLQNRLPEVRLLPTVPPLTTTDAWPSGKAPVSKTGEARRSRAAGVRVLQHPPTPRYPNSVEEAGSDPVNVLVRIQLGAPHPTQSEDDDVDTNDEFRF